ncbi:putative helicase mov-10-B.1 isoform X2 [Corticium candelabrum]|nr:putative helicase mov-10-B.1 isoform X2 [Corticium candelabrum]
MTDKKEVTKTLISRIIRKPYNREVLMLNKCDVSITTTGSAVDDAKLELPVVALEDTLAASTPTRNRTAIDVEIINDSDCHSKSLLNVAFLEETDGFRLLDKSTRSELPSSKVEIPKNGSYMIIVVFAPKHVSLYKNTLVFEFLDHDTGKKFHIIRFLKGRVHISGMEILQPTAPYQRKKLHPRSRLPIVDGIKPPRPDDRIVLKRPLLYYDIPKKIKSNMNRDEPQGDLETLLRSQDPLHHTERLQALLWIEERQMHRDIRHYDRQKEMKSIPQGHLELEVAGLAENRPSLLKGDNILATWVNAKEKYRGYVHKVLLEKVWLKFDRRFHDQFVSQKQYNIEFTFRRTTLRLQHRALDSAEELPKGILHPESVSIYSMIRNKLRFYDIAVERNPEQKRAVEAIVAGRSNDAPYIIYGPPGTGKTKTTVEAIKQVLKASSGHRVLACAPSNSATDLLCEGILKHWPKSEVLRLNAYTRQRTADIPECVMEVSCYDCKTEAFEMPERRRLDNYRVIVCTLTTSGRLVSIPMPAGHFTHIFVDESGHAVEPECLIPLAGLYHPACHFIMAGDPKQLGPVLRSHAAMKYGLNVSLLERLMTTCSIYQPQTDSSKPKYNNDVITKLIENYRSHPLILELPNEEFYDRELVAKADELLREELCQWQDLPRKGFPLVFHGIEGKDERESDSPSFFNVEEIVTVWTYIDKLLKSRGVRVEAKEIGVISPYRKQVEKIRTFLKKKNCEGIKVGSVEEFQGQERKVIILSTVRSNPEYLNMDRQYNLGFLDNPKRFNVAITRAKALLVVVGNPKLLIKDVYWRKLIAYITKNGGYTGIKFEIPTALDESSDDESGDNSDTDEEDEKEEPPESKVTAYEHPEWKRE